MNAILLAWILPALILSFCSPSPASSMPTLDAYAKAEGDSLMSARVHVELDIFSGNPNPVWILSEADGVLFLKKLAMLPKASAKELHDDLGYRGFIVKVTNETGERLVRISLVRIQNGTVQLSQNDTTVYYIDQDRHLERWLLNSGKPTLRSDLFKIVERDFPENSTNQSYPLE
jgi:DNA-binding MarR family transcriptional regulator